MTALIQTHLETLPTEGLQQALIDCRGAIEEGEYYAKSWAEERSKLIMRVLVQRLKGFES